MRFLFALLLIAFIIVGPNVIVEYAHHAGVKQEYLANLEALLNIFELLAHLTAVVGGAWMFVTAIRTRGDRKRAIPLFAVSILLGVAGLVS